jgi:hypothetical protein
VANGKANAAGHSAVPLPFKYFFWGQVFELLRADGRTILICGTVGFCFYELAAALRTFAGQVTFASMTLRILANIVFHWTLTIAVSGISLALYFRERHQHGITRERLTKRTIELETRFNASRTSSQLTTKGRTRKEDK